MFKESVEYNLQELLPELGTKPVTGSAFSQARYKIQSDFFKDLNRLPLDTYQASSKRLWKGHILLAGDGSTLNLPSSESIKGCFGIHSTNDVDINRYLARVFFIYDVLNDVVVGSRLSKMERGEKPLLLECLDSLEQDRHILILDRGFGNFCTIKQLANHQSQFCVRLGIKNSNFAKAMLEDDRQDFVTVWKSSPKEKENCMKKGLDYEPLTLRVSKIKLKTGETELLVTNLQNTKNYTLQDLAELYALRWGVEEGFKNLKPKMKIEHFGCKKAEGIFQEFYAHIFFMNMVALIGMAANHSIKEKTGHRKWEYKYNWKNAYRFLKAKMIKLLHLKEIGDLFDKLLIKVANSIIALKPDRTFIRDTRHRNKKRITQFNK
ncbi:MAG: hypothetical protein Roseis3KO_22560 [Roseivirga sp.]